MAKNILLTLLCSFLMTACVTVSVQTVTAPAPPFVTVTLPTAKMVTPQPSATSASVPTEASVPLIKEEQCENKAVLVADVTYPDNSNVAAGKVFTKTWRLKNTGSCPWKGFTVVYTSGERMNAPNSVPVPETPAGGTVDLSVDLTAPSGDGTYTTYFSLQSVTGESIHIGTEPTFYAKLIVGAGGQPVLGQSQSAFSGVPAVTVGNVNIHCKYSYSENAAYVQELASLINQARVNAGLTGLAINPLLTHAAQGHSVDMACNNFLSHESSDGSFIGALVRAVGYPNSNQEIIAIGTPRNAMDQWAADNGHWEIVLNAFATEMGVGYAYNSSSNYGGYFTVDIH